MGKRRAVRVTVKAFERGVTTGTATRGGSRRATAGQGGSGAHAGPWLAGNAASDIVARASDDPGFVTITDR